MEPTEKQLKGIDDMLRETTEGGIFGRPHVDEVNNTLPSLSWNDAKAIGSTIMRPKTTMTGQRMRGPIATSFFDEVVEAEDRSGDLDETLQSLSGQIHEMAVQKNKPNDSFVIRDVNTAPPSDQRRHRPERAPPEPNIEAVASKVQHIAKQQQHAAATAARGNNQQYWRSRQSSGAQIRGAQEEYYHYRQHYNYPQHVAPGQVVDMMPSSSSSAMHRQQQQMYYQQQQQQPPMVMHQQIYTLRQDIHKLHSATEQQYHHHHHHSPQQQQQLHHQMRGRRDDLVRGAPGGGPPIPSMHPHHLSHHQRYNVAAHPYAYNPPPVPSSSADAAGMMKKGRSRRGGARQRGKEAPPGQQPQHRGGGGGDLYQPQNMVVVTPSPAIGVVPGSSPSSSSKNGAAVPLFSAGDLRGKVGQLCRDQHGSRFLQGQLEEDPPTPEKLVIVEEVVPKTRELAADVFGNYVVQKLLTHGDAAAVEGVAEQLTGHAVALSLHVYGCRVVQKALEQLPPSKAVIIVKEFKSNVQCCLYDQNGNHVIQKCVEVTSKARKKALELKHNIPESTSSPPLDDDAALVELGDQIDFILDSFAGKTRSLAMHAYGCRVLQRVLEHCTHAESARILDELRDGELRELIENQYANYVVQHAIQYGRDQDRSVLVAAVRANLVEFSRHKFASNVVEKCLEYGNAEQKKQLIDEIAAPGGDDRNALRQLIVDNFANYVVQKVVDLADERQLNNIIEAIRPIVSQIQHTHAKHILGKIEKRCPQVKFH